MRSSISHSLRSALLVLWPILLPVGITANAQAQDIRLGLAVPLSGSFQLLGQQFADGARVAAQDGGIELVEVDDSCSPESGEQAARAMAEAGVSMVIGFLCTPTLEAAMPILAETGVPVLTPIRTPSLTDRKERTGWPIWRIAPRADDEAEAIARILINQWRRSHFAIVDDGTIYGRDIAENLRAEAELAGLRPVLFDTFRPQMENQVGLVGRLRRSGATHVFVGGDRSDIAIIARDARKIYYDVVIAGGEALRAADEAIALPPGIRMIAAPRWEDIASRDVIQQVEDAGIVPEGYVVLGHAAVDVAAGAVRAALDDETPVEEQLRNFTFDTAIGLIRFNEKGDLAGNPYRLFIYDGTEFVEAGE